MQRIIIIVFAMFIAAGVAPAATVVNHDFETGDNTGWTGFGATDGVENLGTWFGGIAAHEGTYGWGAAASFATKDGGCYQQVTDAIPGADYTVSVWMHNGGDTDGTNQGRIGIVDGAVTDPQDGNIQWSNWESAQSAWTQATTPSITASGSTITIFLEHDQVWAHDWNINRFDLVELDETAPPTPTPGASVEAYELYR